MAHTHEQGHHHDDGGHYRHGIYVLVKIAAAQKPFRPPRSPCYQGNRFKFFLNYRERRGLRDLLYIDKKGCGF